MISPSRETGPLLSSYEFPSPPVPPRLAPESLRPLVPRSLFFYSLLATPCLSVPCSLFPGPCPSVPPVRSTQESPCLVGARGVRPRVNRRLVIPQRKLALATQIAALSGIEQ